jgi:hypothetical protein
MAWHHQCRLLAIIVQHFMTGAGFGGWVVLWRRPVATIKGWNCASQPAQPTNNYSQTFEGKFDRRAFPSAQVDRQNFQNLSQRSQLCGILEFTLCQRNGKVWWRLKMSIFTVNYRSSRSFSKVIIGSFDKHGSCESQRTWILWLLAREVWLSLTKDKYD